MLDKLKSVMIGWLLLPSLLMAQEVTVRGGFVEDQMKLGENVRYWMSARYPENLEMLLPDSNFQFSPFEFASKNYYQSIEKDGFIIDSAVYTLQSYEIDPVQYLSLPGMLLLGRDTSRIAAAPDSVLLFQLTGAVSDTTTLKTNLAYQEVPTRFNYPLMWIILGSLGVVALLTGVIFGKRIRKWFKLRKLRKDYEGFSEQLTEYIRSLKMEPKEQVAERAISDWKAFLERMENKPYTRLTTREIMAMEYTGELREALKNIDRCVYGKISNENLYKEFQAVEDFTQHRYAVITDEIKNG